MALPVSAVTEAAPRRGRPRDPRVEEAVRRATRELLAEVGYRRLTLGAVADRAAVSRPTVRLRWPTKAELVHDAVFRDAEELPVPDTGSLESDLRACVANTIRVFRSPSVLAALHGLLDDVRHQPGMGDALRGRIHGPSVAGFQDLLDRAEARGEAEPALSADVLLDIITGSVLVRLTISGGSLRRLEDELVETLLAALRPRRRRR